MNFNYTKGVLLSDLLISYNSTNENKYLNEIKNRMFFCGFNEKEINELIRFENYIIDSKDDINNKKILENFYIISKNNENYIFDNPDSYMFNPDKDNKKTLMISQLISIIDEAIYLTYSSKINTYKAKDEIIEMSLENSNNWLFFEFKNRIEYICRCANNIINGPKKSLFNKKINILYDNEMQICLSRWDIDVSSRNFIPYTKEYFI